MLSRLQLSRLQRLFLGISLLLVGSLILGRGYLTPLGLPPLAQAADHEKPRSVQLIIDYADGVQKRFTKLPWREEMTVYEALLAAGRHPRGIKIKFRGSGATAFVMQIDDLKNEGFGADAKNWIYKVNGETASLGAGSMRLERGDIILWTYGQLK